MKKFLEAWLMTLSGAVAILLAVNHTAPWFVIFTYWTVLAVKNTYDFLGGDSE